MAVRKKQIIIPTLIILAVSALALAIYNYLEKARMREMLETSDMHQVQLPETAEIFYPFYDSGELRWGYTNSQGTVTISPLYRFAGEFQDGEALVWFWGEEAYGIEVSGAIKIDTAGNQIASVYEWVLAASEFPIAVWNGKAWGYVNETFQEVIPLKYHAASAFTSNQATVIPLNPAGHHAGVEISYFLGLQTIDSNDHKITSVPADFKKSIDEMMATNNRVYVLTTNALLASSEAVGQTEVLRAGDVLFRLNPVTDPLKKGMISVSNTRNQTGYVDSSALGLFPFTENLVGREVSRYAVKVSGKISLSAVLYSSGLIGVFYHDDFNEQASYYLYRKKWMNNPSVYQKMIWNNRKLLLQDSPYADKSQSAADPYSSAEDDDFYYIWIFSQLEKPQGGEG